MISSVTKYLQISHDFWETLFLNLATLKIQTMKNRMWSTSGIQIHRCKKDFKDVKSWSRYVIKKIDEPNEKNSTFHQAFSNSTVDESLWRLFSH